MQLGLCLPQLGPTAEGGRSLMLRGGRSRWGTTRCGSGSAVDAGVAEIFIPSGARRRCPIHRSSRRRWIRS